MRRASAWAVRGGVAAAVVVRLVDHGGVALGVGAPASTAAASGSSAPSSPPPRPAFAADAALLGGRLRVMGRPGDWVLQNAQVTAVVRQRDGALVDFWRNDAVPPSVPQLKSDSHIDGLWVLQPLLKDSRGSQLLSATRVEADGASIVASARASLGAGSVEVTTRYRLDGDLPAVIVDGEVRHVAGGKVVFGMGDLVKWGNVDYFVGGLGRRRGSYSGRAPWVGRKGAGGDLLIESLTGATLSVGYKETDLGSAPPLYTEYRSFTLAPGASERVRRRLAYREIAEAGSPAPSGRLLLTIKDEQGRPLAAKIGLRGRQGTNDPAFGNDGDETGAGRYVWTGNGDVDRPLPPGKYSALVTAGPEREAARLEFDIGAEAVRLEATLPRAYATPGWLTGDLHLHQAASPDADIACTTRVISAAAEGLELAVPTDHYTAVSLQPAIDALLDTGELARPLLTMMGSEVSTVGNLFGHFNVFPLSAEPRARYEDTTPAELIPALRADVPTGIVQLNHPRTPDLGYFWRYSLDPKTGRFPYSLGPSPPMDFDAIEVMNGSDAVSEARTRVALFDWIHLLGRGLRFTATGNSDSHKLFFLDPGVPRNFIRWGKAESDDDDLDATPEQIVAAIKAGHVVVSSGPFLDVSVGDAGPGDTVRASGPVDVRIRVLAPAWIDVTDVDVLVGGAGNRVRWIGALRTREPLRLDTTVRLNVKVATFVVVVVRGAGSLPNVHFSQVRPFAFSNPIFIEP